MKQQIPLIVLCAAGVFAAGIRAQDVNQSELRQNPEMESAKVAVYVAPSIDYPWYVDLAKNHIDLNGDDWSTLASILDNACTHRVNIVHIGDSHLQADMGTAVTRTRLGEHYGSAGRALIVPFKLAGTNEPVDYAVTATTGMAQARLLKTPWGAPMSFTGIGIAPEAEKFDLTITAREPFDSVGIYFSAGIPTLLSDYPSTTVGNTMGISLPDTTSAITLSVQAPAGTAFHGFNLLRGICGVAYHVIGNNGATYGTYNGIPSFASHISSFSPALIVISLGTNEAFNTTTDADMRRDMDILITDLRRQCPEAKLLLTTPSECQRKTSRRRKGRRKARTSFAVNANVKRLRGVILDYARDNGIPVYDFYAVAGNDGSSTKWLGDKYLNTDRIHLTRAGYTLQGHLFTDALEEALSSAR